MSGIRVQHGSSPRITHCWLYQNKLPGLVVETDSHAIIQQCTVHSGEQAGLAVIACYSKSVRIYFCNNGHGTVEGCVIYGNSLAGVEVATEADPIIRNCNIFDNLKYGVHYREKGCFQLLIL